MPKKCKCLDEKVYYLLNWVPGVRNGEFRTIEQEW